MMELFRTKYGEGFLSNSMFYVVLTFSAFVLIIIKTLGRNPKHVKFASLLKGPTPIPIFGNGLQYLAAGTEAPRKLLSWGKKYGPIFRLWFANDLYVVISDVDYLKDIFNNSKVMFHGPNFAGLWKFFTDSNGAEEDVWRAEKRWQSHFLPSTVKTLVPEMNKIADQLMDYVEEKSGSEFDVADIVYDFTFDTFTSTQFDYTMDSPTKKRFDFGSKTEKALKISVGLSMFIPGMGSKFTQYIINDILTKSLRKSVHRYLRMMTKTIPSIQNNIEKSTGNEKRKNDSSEIDPSGMILYAASEGTHTTMSFALLMIAMHDSVQEKLYKEIQEVFGDDPRQANYEDIERLSYMDQVISETLRRHIHPLIVRYVSEDTRIGPYIFPKGTNVIIDSNSIHMNENLYPRPLEFNPDNFNEEIAEKRSPHSFLGFSAGTRRCMGQTFARADIKLALVKILRKFIVRTSMKVDDMKYIGILGNKSANGYPISFVPRE